MATSEQPDDESGTDPGGGIAGMSQESFAAFRTGAMLARHQLANGSGNGGFRGTRDLNETLGYDDQITDDMYWSRYLRQDIARTIVDKPAKSTWKEQPDLEDVDNPGGEEGEGDPDDSGFQTDVQTLFDDHDLLDHLTTVDRLTGVGRFGLLVIGFKDGRPLSEPVATERLNGTDDLAYFQPVAERQVKQIQPVTDTQSERWGEVKHYQIDFSQGKDMNKVITGLGGQEEVHPSRVIHIAENTLTSQLIGRPRLEAVWNRLTDLAKVIGSAAEMAWRGADYGLLLQADPEAAAALSEDQKQSMEDEAMAYTHGLQPFLRMSGMEKVERLGGDVTDPSGLVEVILKMIAGQTGIPQRILTGSERGELASTQDRATWLGRVAERQKHFAETQILRPLIDKFLKYGILSAPGGDGYDVEWPDLFELSDIEKAEVAQKKADAFTKAASALMKAEFATIGEARQEIFGWGVEIGSETGEDIEIEIDQLPGDEGADPPDDGGDPPDPPDDGGSDRSDPVDEDGEEPTDDEPDATQTTDYPDGVAAAMSGHA